ncbi:hypothetical protein ColLi_11363 [Colletotrichum liriopes]|uniref:Uncharacterized protein n=1 Tax=Colletotrichum liriopes TaxID=708192 RepID=A0AA37LWZ9_9PEZI|nr:hypothetical protein ColLi_11363 [Colletotrichum liriopes]
MDDLIIPQQKDRPWQENKQRDDGGGKWEVESEAEAESSVSRQAVGMPLGRRPTVNGRSSAAVWCVVRDPSKTDGASITPSANANGWMPRKQTGGRCGRAFGRLAVWAASIAVARDTSTWDGGNEAQ